MTNLSLTALGCYNVAERTVSSRSFIPIYTRENVRERRIGAGCYPPDSVRNFSARERFLLLLKAERDIWVSTMTISDIDLIMLVFSARFGTRVPISLCYSLSDAWRENFHLNLMKKIVEFLRPEFIWISLREMLKCQQHCCERPENAELMEFWLCFIWRANLLILTPVAERVLKEKKNFSVVSNIAQQQTINRSFHFMNCYIMHHAAPAQCIQSVIRLSHD